jgi:hypothetical protein
MCHKHEPRNEVPAPENARDDGVPVRWLPRLLARWAGPVIGSVSCDGRAPRQILPKVNQLAIPI